MDPRVEQQDALMTDADAQSASHDGQAGDEDPGVYADDYTQVEDAEFDEDIDIDDDDDDDDGDEPEFLDPDNPLLAAPQAALTKQLESANNRLDLELREREEELRKTHKEREDIGVELYSVQQRLARLQMQVENVHDDFSTINKVRDASDHESAVLREQLEQRVHEVEEDERLVHVHQQELDKVNAALHQVNLNSEELEKEIKVTRRATHKAEESIAAQEKAKMRQDYVIDKLNEQLKGLHDKLSLYQAQLLAQRGETGKASSTLSDAAAEMEAIDFEKKQLVQQWKSSLLGLQRRDTHLKSIEEAIHGVWEASGVSEGELAGYKASLRVAQEQHEQLTGTLNKVQTEVRFLERQLRQIHERRATLTERYNQHKKAVDVTDRELSQLLHERTLTRNKEQVVVKERRKLQNSIKQYEDEILTYLSSQTTLHKGTQSTMQDTERLRRSIEERDADIAGLENELARIQVDTLNTQGHNNALKEALQGLLDDLKAKDAMIEQYEVEIRRRHDEIEKKQSEVDRLNRRYDQLTSNMVDENLGPLEATIHNLQKSINERSAQSAEAQHQWIVKQTELVGLVNQADELARTTHDLKSQRAVIDQRRMRLDQELKQQQREINSLQGSIRHLHNDMTKLNDLISKNSTLKKALEDGTLALENDFVNKLKDEEIKAIEMEERIEAIRAERRDVRHALVEAEQQIMLWEKKIQLGRETQDALDPNIGATETRMMTKEIHRMRLRLTELKRRQDMLVTEMERAVTRRESIATRSKTSGRAGAAITKASLRKAIADAQKKLRSTNTETAKLETEIKTVLAEQTDIGQEVEEISSECAVLRQQEDQLNGELEDALCMKQRKFEQVTKAQRVAKAFEPYLKKDRVFEQYDDARMAKLDAAITRERTTTERTGNVLAELLDSHPAHASALRQLQSYQQDFLVSVGRRGKHAATTVPSVSAADHQGSVEIAGAGQAASEA